MIINILRALQMRNSTARNNTASNNTANQVLTEQYFAGELRPQEEPEEDSTGVSGASVFVSILVVLSLIVLLVYIVVRVRKAKHVEETTCLSTKSSLDRATEATTTTIDTDLDYVEDKGVVRLDSVCSAQYTLSETLSPRMCPSFVVPIVAVEPERQEDRKTRAMLKEYYHENNYALSICEENWESRSDSESDSGSIYDTHGWGSVLSPSATSDADDADEIRQWCRSSCSSVL